MAVSGHTESSRAPIMRRGDTLFRSRTDGTLRVGRDRIPGVRAFPSVGGLPLGAGRRCAVSAIQQGDYLVRRSNVEGRHPRVIQAVLYHAGRIKKLQFDVVIVRAALEV